jgi:hypothetical protein
MNVYPKLEVREAVAAVQHDLIWSHWTKYQFSQCIENDDGSLNIPAELVDRWRRQADTLYVNLTDQEKQSDLHQADKVLDLLDSLNITTYAEDY